MGPAEPPCIGTWLRATTADRPSARLYGLATHPPSDVGAGVAALVAKISPRSGETVFGHDRSGIYPVHDRIESWELHRLLTV